MYARPLGLPTHALARAITVVSASARWQLPFDGVNAFADGNGHVRRARVVAVQEDNIGVRHVARRQGERRALNALSVILPSSVFPPTRRGTSTLTE